MGLNASSHLLDHGGGAEVAERSRLVACNGLRADAVISLGDEVRPASRQFQH